MSRRRQGEPVRCYCGKRVAVQTANDITMMVEDFDLPWLTCPDCLVTSRISELQDETARRRRNGWER